MYTEITPICADANLRSIVHRAINRVILIYEAVKEIKKNIENGNNNA
jgi:hypothetical protein